MQDAYARGAVSILVLLDAQNAALVAEQVAENAIYDFMIDQMGVERAVGKFYLQMDETEAQDFVQRLEAFFDAAGL